MYGLKNNSYPTSTKIYECMRYALAMLNIVYDFFVIPGISIWLGAGLDIYIHVYLWIHIYLRTTGNGHLTSFGLDKHAPQLIKMSIESAKIILPSNPILID